MGVVDRFGGKSGMRQKRGSYGESIRSLVIERTNVSFNWTDACDIEGDVQQAQIRRHEESLRAVGAVWLWNRAHHL